MEPCAAWAWRERCWRPGGVHRECQALRARRAVQPGRGGAWRPGSPAAGKRKALRLERAPSRTSCAPAEAERHRDVRARARGPKRATSDKRPGFIGRSDPFDAQGSGAKSRGTRRAACDDSLPLGAAGSCRPRAGRDVRGPTCGRGSAGGDSRRGSWPASKAPRWRASFRSGRSSCRHGGALR